MRSYKQSRPHLPAFVIQTRPLGGATPARCAPHSSVLPRVARHAPPGQSTARETATVQRRTTPPSRVAFLHRRQGSRTTRLAPSRTLTANKSHKGREKQVLPDQCGGVVGDDDSKGQCYCGGRHYQPCVARMIAPVAAIPAAAAAAAMVPSRTAATDRSRSSAWPSPSSRFPRRMRAVAAVTSAAMPADHEDRQAVHRRSAVDKPIRCAPATMNSGTSLAGRA
jgi:hypothetical protein